MFFISPEYFANWKFEVKKIFFVDSANITGCYSGYDVFR
jgi:hypothetical protein